MPAIVLHHLNNSRSQRIIWLLEELEIPYEIKFYERQKTMLAPEELKAVHPLGKSPVLTDGDLTLAESGLIIEYLVEKYGNGKFMPTSESLKLRCKYWLHYSEGSLQPNLILKLIFDKIESTRMPFFAKPIAKKIVNTTRSSFINPQLKLHLEYLEAELGENEWFVGNQLSAADFQLSFPLEGAASKGLLEDKPRLKAFVQRVHSMPAYRRALQKGGTYAYASL